jgi:hypothetical protein
MLKVAAVIFAAWLHATSGLARDSARVEPVLGPAPKAPREVTGMPGGGPSKLDVTGGLRAYP